MNRFRLLKICACFLLTFLIGAIAGWHLKSTRSGQPSISTPVSPSQRVMDNLNARLKLSREQQSAVQPILEEWGRQVEKLPRQPRLRRDLFEAYQPRIRTLLHPEQFAEYDKIVAEARARFERRLR
jgi:hypothetical protein